MKRKVKLIKPIRHGCRRHRIGEIGTVVSARGSYYDYYVRFPGYTDPIGVQKDQVEFI